MKTRRELSQRVEERNLKAGNYSVLFGVEPKASNFQFPKIIMDIKPIFVEISREGWVRLEIGGLPHYGLVAYPDDNMEDYYWQGDTELIPGL